MERTRLSTTERPADWPIRFFAVLLLVAGATGIATAFAATAPEVLTRAAEGFAAERGDAGRRPRETLEEFDAGRRAAAMAKAGPTAPEQRAVSCCGFRIYDARTELFDDYDRDGYYTYLRVTFDVDTDYSEADVYADVWLRRPGGQYVLIYETEVFNIRGASATDDYEVEAELLGGFPPDLYDVLIEVYDAYDGRFVADFDALDSSALGLLPLEDVSFDDGPTTPVVRADGSGGSGAFSLGALAVLAAAGVLRRRRHRSANGLQDRRG